MPDKADLRIKQAAAVPLVNRIRAFNKSQKDAEFWDAWSEQTTKRIYNSLAECRASGKSAKQCQGLCNIKAPKLSIKPKK